MNAADEVAGRRTAPAGVRRRQAARTRARLLEAGERLVAERGVVDVSSRQIAEAAGQANHSALAYHVGTKHELLVAVLARHHEQVLRITEEMMGQVTAAPEPRDRVAALFAPYVRHLASLGSPSWTARFVAQVLADPTCGLDGVWWEGLTDDRAQAIIDMWGAVPELPADVVELRVQMMRILVVHTCAEQEAEAARTGAAVDWRAVEVAIIDAVTGILTAPATAPHPSEAAPST